MAQEQCQQTVTTALLDKPCGDAGRDIDHALARGDDLEACDRLCQRPGTRRHQSGVPFASASSSRSFSRNFRSMRCA